MQELRSACSAQGVSQLWTLNRIAKRIRDKVLRNAGIDNTRIYNLKDLRLTNAPVNRR